MSRARLHIRRSIAFGEATGARVKDCYRNALRALPQAPKRSKYVVGFVEGVIEHAWLETPSHVILDPTMGASRRLLRSYVAVKRFTWRQILSAASRRKTWDAATDPHQKGGTR